MKGSKKRVVKSLRYQGFSLVWSSAISIKCSPLGEGSQLECLRVGDNGPWLLWAGWAAVGGSGAETKLGSWKSDCLLAEVEEPQGCGQGP